MSATVEAPNTVATTTIASVYTGNDWLKQQTSTVATAGTTNATTTFYGYDRNGAQTNERVGAAGSVEVNEWQFDGTLASTVTQGQATGGSEFVYDAAGNRLKQRTQIGKPEAKEVRYLVDPNTSYAQVVQERDENNVLQARYAWEDGLAPLVMWRRTNTGAYAAFFYLCDGQDSVRQLTDASGKVTDSYFYDAFGNALQGGSGDTPNPFRYTGQQLDASGDYYLRARYYNSGNGRFLSHDPLMGSSSDPVSMHRYLYAANDGVNFTDPSGLQSLGEVSISQAFQFIGNSFKTAGMSTATTLASGAATMYFFNMGLAQHLLYSPMGSNLMPDGIFASFGASVEGSYGKFGASTMLYMNFEDFKNNGSLYLFGTVEAGVRAATPVKYKSFKDILGFSLGMSWNTRNSSTGKTNVGKISGYGANFTMPAATVGILQPQLYPHAYALNAVGGSLLGSSWGDSSLTYSYGQGDGEYGASLLSYSKGMSLSTTGSITSDPLDVVDFTASSAQKLSKQLGLDGVNIGTLQRMFSDLERELINASS